MRRRDVLFLPVLAALPLGACGGSEAPSFRCDVTGHLTPVELATRTSQQYTDQTSHPDHRCSNCRYYTPAPSGECGACQLVRGPIHPEGFCNLWTASG